MYKFEKQLLEESQLRAHTKVTYKTYLLRLRQFHNYIDKPLDQVYLSEIREYFLYLINVYKTAISNNRIVSLENGKVTFNYKDSKTNKTKFVKAYSRKWSFYSDNRTVSKFDVFSRNSSCEYNLFTNKHQIICSDNI